MTLPPTPHGAPPFRGAQGPLSLLPHGAGAPPRVPLTPTPRMQYIHVFLNEVTALVPVFSEAKHSFALYTPERTRQRWPVRLAAATEQDMSDWVSRQGSLGQGWGPPSWGQPGLADPPPPLASSPCSTCPAARAGGCTAAPPHRPSGPSPARGTSL